MNRFLPDVSKKITSKDIFNLLELKYSEIAPVWMPLQLQWMNEAYRTFNDYEKFMIVMHLLAKTFEFYANNFVKLNYEEYFNQNQVEIKKINVMEIANSLNIPKETARRKVVELEELGTIKRLKKKIIIDRETWPNIKPKDTVIRVSRFLSTLSKILYEEELIEKTFSSEHIANVAKENFSYVWKLYYDMQIPMLLNFKEILGDIESFHVHGICLVNQALNAKTNDNSQMSKEYYLEKYFFSTDTVGINAMSISDITGIPRATVIRKLKKLVKNKFLKIDDKKQYLTTGNHQSLLLNIQKKNFQNLSKFASVIFNLSSQKISK
jgi:DNA-binding Lrp family transcriptional regulator